MGVGRSGPWNCHNRPAKVGRNRWRTALNAPLGSEFAVAKGKYGLMGLLNSLGFENCRDAGAEIVFRRLRGPVDQDVFFM
jgi:hypothetical protein